MSDPTARFSNRVQNYIKFRPRYPAAVVETLAARCSLSANSIIADVGSGTGILAENFLRNGNRVFGIEPNREMREAGERQLCAYALFSSREGRAESTSLPGASVDFVTAGQSFHWFDRDQARTEFARILKPGGWAVLIWNERDDSSTPFLAEYEHLLHRYATDYAQVDHRRISDVDFRSFFGSDAYQRAEFPNRQEFDYDGLVGRLLSSSYVPIEGVPSYEPMMAGLANLFETHQQSGSVAFEYRTLMYFGRLER